MELLAKLLDYFLRSNKINFNHCHLYILCLLRQIFYKSLVGRGRSKAFLETKALHTQKTNVGKPDILNPKKDFEHV